MLDEISGRDTEIILLKSAKGTKHQMNECVPNIPLPQIVSHYLS